MKKLITLIAITVASMLFFIPSTKAAAYFDNPYIFDCDISTLTMSSTNLILKETIQDKKH